ncbi:PAX-interacting protein 1-like isoform X2 [Mytilus trossulus]|uniref:PAX-interacting protein 1-like isoform X2 n=1 Tax=Mytilus trossulus TaxID=6551 RepID=UPI003003DA56
MTESEGSESRDKPLDVPEALFKDVKYYVVGDIAKEVLELLNAGGAKQDTYLSEMVSHVISDDPSQDEYSEAKELFDLPVVRSSWVYLSIKCKKQLPIPVFSPADLLFSGVVACSSQLDVDDSLHIWGMITYNGGKCQQKLDSKCTHLITSATEGAKYEAALKHAEKVNIVTPDWVTDSIKKEAKVDESIYHPRLIVYPEPEPPTPPTPPATPPQEKIPTPPLPQPMDTSEPQTMPILDRANMGLPRPNFADFSERVQKGRVRPDKSPRRSPGHQDSAGRNMSKQVSQMLGLNMQVPHRQPPPRYTPPSPQKMGTQQLQQSPYWGHEPSDNVPADMCLLGCVFFITDYQKILGQEQIDNWKKVIEQHGGQVDTSYSNRITHILAANQHSDVFHLALRDQRRVVTAYWLNDVLVKKKMMPPWQALHLPLIYGENKPCSNQVLCMTNFEGEERIRIKQMINAIGARYTGHMTHGNTALICRKPEGEKYEKAKEWKLAVVNVHWLTDLVLGHLDALKLPVQPKYLQLYPDPFQMDVSLVHHLMVGWRSPLKIQRETWKKFLPQQKFRSAPAPGQDNNVENTEPPAKKKKQENEEISIQITNANGPRVLFTGFMKGLAKKLQANVIQLGGMVTENPKQCTHVVAPAISRTMKFFIAVNVCKYVVTKEWLEDSMAKNRFADPNMYALRDIKAESEMQCNLQDSISRAQAKPLFQDVTIYATPSIVPPISDLTKIVGTAGGTVVKRLPSIPLLQEKDDQGNPTHIIVTCEDDVPMLRNIIAKKITIHNAEFVLTGVMRQTLDFKAFVIDVH